MATANKKTIDARGKELAGFGLTLSDDKYSHGDVTITSEVIKTSTPEEWDKLIALLQQELNKDIPLTESENVPDAKSQEMILAETITREVAKIDVNVEQIKKWKRQYAGLKIISLDDKKGLDAVTDAKKIIRKARTAVEKKRVEIKADYIKIGKAIDEKAKEYTAGIEEIENKLDAQLEQHKAWKEEHERKEAEEKKQKLDARVKLLIESGMVFNGQWYVIGEAISQDISSIEGYSDEQFAALWERVIVEKKAIDDKEAARLESIRIEEKKKADEAEAFRIDKEKHDAEVAKFNKERDEMRAQKMKLRDSLLLNIGLLFNPNLMGYQFKNKYSDVSISKADVEGMESEVFDKFIEDNRFIIATAKSNQEKTEKSEQEAKDRLNARTKHLIDLGMIWQKNEYGDRYGFANPDASTIFILVDKVANATDDEFNQKHSEIKDQIIQFDLAAKEKAEADEKAKQAAIQTFNDRSAQLINLGLQSNGKEFFKNDQFDRHIGFYVSSIKTETLDEWSISLIQITRAVELFNQETQDKIKAIEAEKQAALPEIEKVQNYLSAIGNIQVPQTSQKPINQILATFILHLDEIMNQAKISLSNLK